MSATKDTRIVQMQFDNKDFEKNIQTSEKSLDKFKEALNFEQCEESLENFENATKKLTFESMAENLQKLTDKFTGLGTISELILSQIRRGIEDVASKISGLLNSLGFEQVDVGLQKYEQLNKSVQTIMAATGKSEEEVYKVMQRLNEYTDMTSYNFADMAQNIGKFTSVGIPLENAEKQMEGIANWAARSGAGIQEASRAMYNLSQAMGVGKMTKIDWKSIENAGMATKEFKEQMIAAGVANGTLVATVGKNGETVYKTATRLGKQVTVTYQNVADTLSKGWATSQVIQDTLMDYYYDQLKGDSEAVIQLTKEQLEKTEKLFTDGKIDKKEWKQLEGLGLADDKVKEAALDAAVAQGKLASAGEKGGKKLYVAVDKAGKQIEFTMDEIEKSLELGWFDKSVAKNVGLLEDLGKASYQAAQKCTNLTDVLQAWKDQISTGWMRSWQTIFGNLTESMELFSAICNKVGESFTNMIADLVGGTDANGDKVTGILEQWAELGGRNNLWSMFVGEYDDLYKGAYGILDVIHDIGDMIGDAFVDVMSIFVGEDRRGIFKSDKNARNAWFAIQLNNITDTVRNAIQSIKDFFNEIPNGSTQSRLQILQNIVTGVFSALLIAAIAVHDIIDFFKGVAAQLQPSFDAILGLLGAFGIDLKSIAEDTKNGEGLKKLFDELLVTIQPLTDAINKLIIAVTDNLKKFFKEGKDNGTFKKIWQTIIDIINLAAKVIAKVGGPILDFVMNIMNIISDLFSDGLSAESLKKAGRNLEQAITKLFDGLFGLIPGIGNKIQSFIAYIFGFAEDNVEDGADGESKTILGVLKKWLRKIFGGVASFIGSFKDEMGNVTLFSLIKEHLGLGLLASLLQQFSGIVKGTNLYGIIMAFLGGYALFKLIKMLKQGGGLFRELRGFFQGARDTLKDGLKLKFGDELESTGDKMLKIAKAIALVVASVAVLGSMSVDNLVKGLFVLTLTLTAFGLFLYAVKNYIAKDFKEAIGMTAAIMAVAIGITALTVGVSILILSLKAFSNMKPEGFIRATVGLLVVLGSIVAFAYALKQLKIGSIKIAGIASLALGIGIMVASLIPLANLEWGQLAKVGAGLIVFLGAILLFTKLMSGLTMAGSGMFQIALLGIGIGFMVNAFIKLANMNFNQLMNIADGLILFLGAILVFIVLLNKNSGSMKSTGMFQLIMLAGAIWILMETLKPLASMEWEDLAKIGAGLIATMFVMASFINNTQSMKGTGMLNMVLIAASIWLLLEALKPLAKFEWGDLAKMGAGLIVLGAVIVGITHLIKPLNLIEGGGVAIMLGGLAVVFASFALVMAAIHDVKWEVITAACYGLIALLVVFGLIIKFLLKGTDILEATHTLIALAGLAVIMIAFSIALNEIKNVPVDKIASFSEGLAVLMVALAITIKVLESVSIVGALKAIAVIGVAFAALAVVLSLTIPLLLNALGSSFQTFSAKMSLMSGMFLDFTTMMNKIKMEDIQAAKAKIEAIMEVVKSLKDAGDYIDAIHAFSECMLLLGSGVSQFMFSTSDVNGNPDDMPALKLIQTLIGMKEDLKNFSIGDVANEFHLLGTGLSLFQTATQNITNGDNVPALKMAQAIINMQSGLQNFTAGNSAMEFFTLGVGLSLFDTATESIQITNPDEMPAIKMAQAIINMQSGLQNFTAGNSAMEFFNLGVGLSLFNTATSSISISNPDDMPALKMASAILNLQNSLSSFSVGDSMSQFFRLGIGLRSFNASVSDITTGEPVAFQLLKNLADQADNLTKLTQLPLETFKAQLSGLGGALSIYAEGVQAATGLDLGKNGEAPDVSSAIELLHALTDGIANDEKGFQIPDIPDQDAMAGFGADLAALATALKKFSDAAKDMNPLSNLLALNCLDFMAKLKERLTEDNLKVTKAFTDNGIYDKSVLESFGTDLIALGVALKDYSSNTADFKKNDAALDTLDFLADIRGKLQTQDVIATKIFSANGIYSETPLKQFGLDLAALGTSLADYNKSTKDFEKNQGALDTLQFLTDIRGKLQTQDILVTQIFSKNGINSEGPLKQFGLDLAALGTSLANYNTSTAEFKKNDEALEVLTFLADLRGQLTEDNIKTVNAFTDAGITSTKPLEEFGLDLAALGNSLGNFNTNVKDFSVGRNVYSALSFFKNLKDELTADTLQNAFIFDIAGVHKETLSSFGTDISALGEALGGFATNVNFDESKSANFDQAISALDKLKDISNRLPYIGGIKALWEGNQQTLSDIATHIKSVGESFAQMSTDLSGDAENGIKSFDVELVGSAFDMLQKVGDLIATLAIKDPTAVMANDASGYLSMIDNMLMLMTNGLFATGEKAIIPKLVTFMDQYREATKAVGGFGEKDLNIFEAVRKMLESLQLLMSIDPSYDFSKLGESMSKGIKDGITGFSDPVTDAIKTLINNIMASADIAMTSPESGLTPKQIGLNIVEGLKNGLTDAPSVQAVIDASVDLIRKAKDAAKAEADVQSPSRVFEQIGAYISQGLAIGIDKESDEASKSGRDMVGNIVDNADRALANLSYLIANGVDANPTITPVLDLSNVRTGMAELNSGFGDRRIGLDTSGIARRANASAWNLNAHPETVVQNGTDLSGVYERMSTLGSQIIEMGNKISKMQLVLDTGAVAGGVINDIDSGLGRRTFYAGRRN